MPLESRKMDSEDNQIEVLISAFNHHTRELFNISDRYEKNIKELTEKSIIQSQNIAIMAEQFSRFTEQLIKQNNRIGKLEERFIQHDKEKEFERGEKSVRSEILITKSTWLKISGFISLVIIVASFIQGNING